MIIPGRAANRMVSIFLYIGGCLLLLGGGLKLINYSIDSKFYSDFLVPWKIAANAYGAKGLSFKDFTGNNHVLYMDNLVRSMNSNGIFPPSSNTGRKFIYRIGKMGHNVHDYDVLLLCLEGRIVIYGLPEETFLRIDKFVDDAIDMNSGNFIGQLAHQEKTYTGSLLL